MFVVIVNHVPNIQGAASVQVRVCGPPRVKKPPKGSHPSLRSDCRRSPNWGCRGILMKQPFPFVLCPNSSSTKSVSIMHAGGLRPLSLGWCVTLYYWLTWPEYVIGDGGSIFHQEKHNISLSCVSDVRIDHWVQVVMASRTTSSGILFLRFCRPHHWVLILTRNPGDG